MHEKLSVNIYQDKDGSWKIKAVKDPATVLESRHTKAWAIQHCKDKDWEVMRIYYLS